MLNLSFCNYHSRLNKDIKVKTSLEENYRQYVIQLDKQVNRIYGLPSIFDNNGIEFKEDLHLASNNYQRYLKRRDNLRALLLALQDYDDKRIPDKDFQGINLLPIDYNVSDHRQIYEGYNNLLFFLHDVIERSSSHSGLHRNRDNKEWFKLLNETWYQVHLLHNVVIKDKFDTESLILSIGNMIDWLNNVDNYSEDWRLELTPIGREHVNKTISRLHELRELLKFDLWQYGNKDQDAHKKKPGLAYRGSSYHPAYRSSQVSDYDFNRERIIWEDEIPRILRGIVFIIFIGVIIKLIIFIIIFTVTSGNILQLLFLFPKEAFLLFLLTLLVLL